MDFKNNMIVEELTVCIEKTLLLFEIGSYWHYNLSIDVVGRVIEIVSHMALNQFFKQEIFDPLSMLNYT